MGLSLTDEEMDEQVLEMLIDSLTGGGKKSAYPALLCLKPEVRERALRLYAEIKRKLKVKSMGHKIGKCRNCGHKIICESKRWRHIGFYSDGGSLKSLDCRLINKGCGCECPNP